MKCRFSLSYRDLEKMARLQRQNRSCYLLQRVDNKVCAADRYGAIRKRKKPVVNSSRMDETYIKINSAWVYLFGFIYIEPLTRSATE